MIVITGTTQEGFIKPQRILTNEEKESVVFTLFDGNNYNYYQLNDELPIINLEPEIIE